jgi:HNH endonuclease
MRIARGVLPSYSQGVTPIPIWTKRRTMCARLGPQKIYGVKITLDTPLVQCYAPFMITYQQAHQLFDYDPQTGELTRKNTGKRAGTTSYQNGKPERRKVRIGKGERLNEAVVIWLWMTGSLPLTYVDHIDLNPFNNKWSNLREANHSQNTVNSPKFGSSQYKWVHKVGNRYKARVSVNGKRTHAGYYDTPEEAYDAALDLASKLHGPYMNGG